MSGFELVRVSERTSPPPAAAIVGMSCLLPGALDLESFWRALLEGRNVFREPPPSRWSWSRYQGLIQSHPEDVGHRPAAFLEGFEFSWRKYRLPPRLVQQLNPMHLALLEATGRALEDAGPPQPEAQERTGYVLGSLGMGIIPDHVLRVRARDYLEGLERTPAFQALTPVQQRAVRDEGHAALLEGLNPIGEESLLGAIASVPLGRTTGFFGLRGPHFVVDGGSASSLAAIDAGLQLLGDGTCDRVVVAGISPYLQPLDLVAFSKLGTLSRGLPSPFDSRADGTLLGEGVGIVVLERLEDTLQSGRRYYAAITGTGSSCAGQGPALVAPSAEGQALAFGRALRHAGLQPEDIHAVECHATGTRLGDAVEVEALNQVFGPRSKGRRRLVLGSVKELVGHLQAGAGLASLIKATLALHKNVFPPQHRLNQVSPELLLEERPFEVATRPLAFGELAGSAPARVLVNATGFGGINQCVCLEAPGPTPRDRTRRARPRAGTSPEPIAIVGMGCVFPGAQGVPRFWRNNLQGSCHIREVPRERFEIDRYHDGSGSQRERSYTRLGAFIEQVQLPAEVRLPPATLASMDPTQLLVLKACSEALAQAGFSRRPWDKERTAVLIADMPQRQREVEAVLRVSAPEYRKAMEALLARLGVSPTEAGLLLQEAEEAFRAPLPPLTEDTMIGYLGSIISARVSRAYGFHGPSLGVESACASSLHALEVAVRGLRQEQFSVAVCGGVCSNISPEIFAMVCAFNGVSRTGLTPFDARASGFLVGEGAGVIVLKRMSDALRDGDWILASILGTGSSGDAAGRSIFAPDAHGQALAIRRALEQSGVQPRRVGYIECHGTGTAVGDVSEVEAYSRTYGGHGRPTPIALSALKSMIGHLNAAAGVAGIIRAVCALGAKVIPPTLNFETPNPEIDFGRGPFEVISRPMPWAEHSSHPRLAAVSSFGLGGSNAHVILEEGPSP